MQTVTRFLAGALVLLAAIVSAAPAHALTAAAPAVGTFYATTKAVYDAWQGSPAPAQHPSLPAGTTQVGLYFVYSGAKAGVTTYRIAIYTAPKGTAVFVGEKHALTHASNGRMSLVPFDKPLARGLYRADVTLGNGFTASTGFTVGLKNPNQDFYPVTAAAAKSALATDYIPIYRLPSGSKSLNFYYQIAKSVPGKTTVQMKIYTSSPVEASDNLKSSLFFVGHLFTPTSPDAGYKGSRSITSDNALDNGQYQAVLLVNGVPEASTAITVGP